MNTNLKNYSAQPDPEVWEKIEKTMRHRALRRRLARVGAGLAAVAVVVAAVVSLPGTDKAETSAPVAEKPVVAQNHVAATPAVDMAEVVNNPIPATHQAKASTPVENIKQPTTAPGTTAEHPTSTPTQALLPTTSTPAAMAQPLPTYEPRPETASINMAAVASTVATADNAAEEQLGSTTAEAETEERPVAKATTADPMDDTLLWIPNAFAPGSDNEGIRQFRVKLNHAETAITDYRILIVNRKGQQVYISHDINEGWDGTYKGRQMPQAAYIYIIQYTDSRNIKHQCKGTVTLVR